MPWSRNKLVELAERSRLLAKLQGKEFQSCHLCNAETPVSRSLGARCPICFYDKYLAGSPKDALTDRWYARMLESHFSIIHPEGVSMTDLFDVSVPDSDLAAPGFTPMPTAAYRTTLQAGTQLVQNDRGWKGIRLPFAGFRNDKSNDEFERQLNAQFTYELASSPVSVEIGIKGIIGAAQAFGLTHSVTTDGKSSQKLTATSYEQLVDQFNQMAGSECEVYVSLQPRKLNGQIVYKEGTTDPVMGNEIKRISALK